MAGWAFVYVNQLKFRLGKLPGNTTGRDLIEILLLRTLTFKTVGGDLHPLDNKTNVRTQNILYDNLKQL
jgi:hypothetical protein